MDTLYYTQALCEYQMRTHDMRKPDMLPLSVLSSIAQRAQELKTAAQFNTK